MKVRLVIVPPGGGEAEYSRELELEELPRVGDRITLRDPTQLEQGTYATLSQFTVGSVDWAFSLEDDLTELMEVVVECRYALSFRSSERHKTIYNSLVKRYGIENKLDETMY
ncbi:hypothetical protein U8335_26765 [Roseiconus lacunae]|uniref:hypothetical protein n=1 Tax=Roseiconus lacunae TaxID=2605694 RepID=UPI001E3871EC|nr:hypothetical protein [Roseiconus lacunae]MCD0459966.1 hypothetical protein [Roseiconus lacunae]WRQ50537.1 hypothetical protein U8335_26765 [Stieleria sp. HD01]